MRKERVGDMDQKEKEGRLIEIVNEAKLVIQKTENYDENVQEKVEVLKRILCENIQEDDEGISRRKGQV
ncbi:hypothetical protein [Methanohalophilus profundi]|uniref:hypothetical protein n=1 Tax=Methanohalophilus profundi TaxID=2138083 RepID=UPI00101CFCAF|nr:hypothetical protein [Methanohalophilus profundi]